MTHRKYTGANSSQYPGYDSKQEKMLAEANPKAKYHPRVDLHYTLHCIYKPDFYLGALKYPPSPESASWKGMYVYVEAKEWFPPSERVKYVRIAQCNPQLLLLIVTRKIDGRTRDALHTVPNIVVIPECEFSHWVNACGGGHEMS